jgi:hypothetical protein
VSERTQDERLNHLLSKLWGWNEMRSEPRGEDVATIKALFEAVEAERDEWIAKEQEGARLEYIDALGKAEATCRAYETALREYAEHQSWRCDHPDRYPWEPDCPCGLTGDLRALGISVQPGDEQMTPDPVRPVRPDRKARR